MKPTSPRTDCQGFTLAELLVAVTILALIGGLAALVIFSMSEAAKSSRDAAQAMNEADRVFQQIQLDWENRVNGQDVSIILANRHEPGEPILQMIVQGNAPANHRFPVSADEPSSGVSTVAYRLAFPGLERGIAGFSRHDKFAGLLPPDNVSYKNLETLPEHEMVKTQGWQPVPLENWPVPEENFEPVAGQVIAVGLCFQLAESCTIGGRELSPGSVLRSPPLRETTPPAQGPAPIDLTRVGAIHVALVIARHGTLAQVQAHQWQALTKRLHERLDAAEGNLTAYQIWQPLFADPQNLGADLPPQAAAGLRVHQHVYPVE